MKKESYTRFWLIYIALVIICTGYLSYVQIRVKDYVFFSQKDSSGRYKVELTQISGPEKPQGRCMYKLDFYDGDKSLFSMADLAYTNGRLLYDGMVQLDWDEDGVSVEISHQASSAKYHLLYDGEYTSSHTYSKID
ncbi:MAG: hypothetical protein IIY76_05265 [Erysipelotrichaceae bacterium]|nr:hypothetical protein [Erysipelotrichaceae bacterium]